jgi:hypothetical protein
MDRPGRFLGIEHIDAGFSHVDNASRVGLTIPDDILPPVRESVDETFRWADDRFAAGQVRQHRTRLKRVRARARSDVRRP